MHFLFSFLQKHQKSHSGHFENYCFSIIITSDGVIIVTYDAILDQSVRMLLHNHLSNYTNL